MPNGQQILGKCYLTLFWKGNRWDSSKRTGQGVNFFIFLAKSWVSGYMPPFLTVQFF